MSEVITIIHPQTEVERRNRDKIEADKSIALQERLHRLLANPDFNELIMKDYLQVEIQRKGILLSSLSVSPEYKEDALGAVKAVGHFAKYLETVDQEARMHKRQREIEYLDSLELEEEN